MSTELTTYSPPTSSELEQSWYLAQRLGKTEFVPQALRGKPEAVLACILSGRELGIGPMQALNSIHVIQGRPTMSADLMVGLVRRHGHRVRTIERTAETVTVEGVRADDPGHTERVTFSMADAQRAGLNGKENWRQYPAAMLWARAVSALCRIAFNDVLHGVAYTPEEISPDTPAATVIEAGPAEVDGELVGDDGVPKAWTIENIREPEDARWLLQQPEVGDDYRDAVKAVIAAAGLHWPAFWRTGNTTEWRNALRQALQPSGSDRAAFPSPGAPSDPDPTSGAGERAESSTVIGVGASPAPDHNRPPTPTPASEAPTEADRAGVEGGDANHETKPGAGEGPQPPDAPQPLEHAAGSSPGRRPSGGTKRSGGGSSSGKAAAPAGTDEPPGWKR